MNYNESSEDYLEAILMLREQLGKVRSIDIVYKLGYSKPSISIAMKKLREKGLISMDNDGYITLTDEGQKIARHTYTRHKVLTTFFESLGVNPKTIYRWRKLGYLPETAPRKVNRRATILGKHILRIFDAVC